MEPGVVVVDENGTRHTLSTRLGAGGQGEAWLTKSGKNVVKLLAPGRRAEDLRRQIARVKRADLTNLHVAKPLALLRPPLVGYVAEFLADMQPIALLQRPPHVGSKVAWYRDTGGLRRRLRLLAHAGEALHGIHAVGFSYGDVSPANVFVSIPVSAVEAWLIDLDNLKTESDPSHNVFTTGYGAPEVITGQHGATSLSDAWGFAVLLFKTLALVHPFLGDPVDDGEPELEEAAFAGRLPWIDDEQDSRNRCTRGLDRSIVLSKHMRAHATATFGPGRLDRTQRTSVAKWTETLHVAADRTLTCSSCRSTFFEGRGSCPWCAATAPRIIQIEVRRWEPGRGLIAPLEDVTNLVGSLPWCGEKMEVPRRITHGESGIAGRRVGLSVEPAPGGVLVRAPAGVEYSFAKATAAPEQATQTLSDRGATLGVEAPGHLIHLGSRDSRHRVLRIVRPN
jgi:DNA-binding helix-hairpin-helix protein with protein kinase domain